ncbi:hypothetical protein B0H13DRAFT_1870053 [Mycena leptocephala]|nr:hypothetical protein B0H13DRAFT_1870053 [Mycena leptocephala]
MWETHGGYIPASRVSLPRPIRPEPQKYQVQHNAIKPVLHRPLYPDLPMAIIFPMNKPKHLKRGLSSGLWDLIGCDLSPARDSNDFDGLTNQTMYEDSLLGFIMAATKSLQDPVKPKSVGHAAIRAYTAYKNPAFLELANQSWIEDIASASVSGKDFPLQLSCQGATMVGGTFETTNSTSPTIAGFASFSALLAEATSSPIYMDAAFDSAEFIIAHLSTQNLVQSGISAALKDACALDNAPNSSNTGLMIEGLAVLYSITNNASTQAT